ncbi:hypothetical protein K7432_011898 [Basidiobolus ranarum]|uniref:Uncharacterized protein n=1 Tax=Basidiobolus ranarum TaxID=34480 RepID=A0ABR2VTZ7_9FUNG
MVKFRLFSLGTVVAFTILSAKSPLVNASDYDTSEDIYPNAKRLKLEDSLTHLIDGNITFPGHNQTRKVLQNCDCAKVINTYMGDSYFKMNCFNSTYGAIYEYSDPTCRFLSGVYSGGVIVWANDTLGYEVNCTNMLICPISKELRSEAVTAVESSMFAILLTFGLFQMSFI